MNCKKLSIYVEIALFSNGGVYFNKIVTKKKHPHFDVNFDRIHINSGLIIVTMKHVHLCYSVPVAQLHT